MAKSGNQKGTRISGASRNGMNSRDVESNNKTSLRKRASGSEIDEAATEDSQEGDDSSNSTEDAESIRQASGKETFRTTLTSKGRTKEPRTRKGRVEIQSEGILRAFSSTTSDEFTPDQALSSEIPQRVRSSQRVSGGKTSQLSLPLVKKRRRNGLNLSSEELALKKTETAKKRKAMAYMKAEEIKLNTIHKLLRKQAKKRINKEDDLDQMKNDETLIYTKHVQNVSGSSFFIPQEVFNENQYTLENPEYREKKADIGCSVDGCSSKYIYRHPKSGLYSCSSEHYKVLIDA